MAEPTIRSAFERYVAPEVVRRLLDDPDEVQLGGALQTITVLFADLRGYSSLAETLPPCELISVLNGHLSVAAGAILAHEGTISQFAGDQVMAIFNAPCPQPDHAPRAARAALRLRRDLARYHADLDEEFRMSVGMGIVSGEAVVGNIGALEFLHYTAVGDTVNLAKRLEELALGGEILMAASTASALDGLAHYEPRGLAPIRGRSERVPVYALLGLSGEEVV
jgi:class 3 adenylate cyclase